MLYHGNNGTQQDSERITNNNCQTDEKCKHWWYNSEEKSCRLTYDDNINDPWHPDHRMESDKAFVSNSYTPDNLSA
ncbi:hypothetical protein EG68_07946 [Paragonimus skrjabini miyazakii]|uniref:Apple domain-containing protein n=1 Tax=Paragonimus skrjabini miyazakii TaxID=59628 RepID=A0A8S9YNX2_9TREM|nr:hypothetical protein EG68_07946 [Paragonimus skrjabini miyazakii]